MGASGTQNQTASFATNYRQIVKASYLHRYGFNRISYSFRVVISSNTTINGDANIGNLDVDILSTLELHEIDSAASYLTPMQTNKTSVNKNGSKEVFINYDVSIPSGAPEGKYLLPQLKIRVNGSAQYYGGSNSSSAAFTDINVEVKEDLTITATA